MSEPTPDTAAERAREIVDNWIWLHEIPASTEAERTLKHDIAAAQRVAEAYGYDQVVIIARKVGPRNVGGEHVTTYGIDKANCVVAARIGDFIKHKIMDWPEPSGRAEPPREGATEPNKPVDTPPRDPT